MKRLCLFLMFVVLLQGCSYKTPLNVQIMPESNYARGWLDGERDARGSRLWVGAGFGCAGFAPIGAYLLPPRVPVLTQIGQRTSSLIGKSPEYVAGYIEGYRSRSRAQNVKYSLAGWAAWALFYLSFCAYNST